MNETATFGAGCFWGVEQAFRELPGVVETRVGYSGGHIDHPTYKQVCSRQTGHAEVVEVVFDPAEVSYSQLLDAFWQMHDPTQRNRQGVDVGDNYRSVVFFHSCHQEQRAVASRDDLSAARRWRRPIATEILPAGTFWVAEEYHQQYFEKRSLNR